MLKPVRFSRHAHENMRYRGATEREVVEAIQRAAWEPAQGGRLECYRDFPFGQGWNGKFFAHKRVRPIFVLKAAEIVVVTVYVYYF